MNTPFQLWEVHFFLILAFGVLVVIATLHVDVASGKTTKTDMGWSDILSVRIPLVSSTSSFAPPILPLWDTNRKLRPSFETESHLGFVGKYAKLRAYLDYSYHSHYPESRQVYQDAIIDSILNETSIVDRDGKVCSTTNNPWIVYTAGAMGAGKSYTIRQLAAKSRFPLYHFVRIDYDAVRKRLPEFQHYLQRQPDLAGEWTRKEAGYIAELATQAALHRNHNVLVDGSLRDAEWFQKYFAMLRRNHPRLRIGIIHVTAPQDAVFQRAEDRSKITGRVVPRETLEHALHQVPRSVQKLAPLADFFCELHNPPKAQDVEITTEGVTWDSFQRAWLQTCPRSDEVPQRQSI